VRQLYVWFLIVCEDDQPYVATKKHIAEVAGIAPSAAVWMIEWLVDLGLIGATRAKRACAYRVLRRPTALPGEVRP
jgi:hypothetical protein